ncbi:MAG: serine hydrolase [Solirubrobacterales bacterium]|nr:serine hydrolase [Solirubrobacterales bacterium]
MTGRGAAATMTGAASIVAVVAVALAAAAPAPAAFTAEQRATVDRTIADEMRRSGYPGMVVGLWSPRGSYVTAQGVSDIDTQAPIDPDQPFRIGSVTKTFTATLVLQLVERGKLRLADRLSRFLPKVPQAKRIRIRNLLSHTSGVPDLTQGINARVQLFPEASWRPGQLIRLTSLQPSQCAVGDCFFYSNTNFVILGRIAEMVTGRPLAQLYERRIFEPLGLEQTSFAPGTSVPADIVHGYIEVAPASITDTTGWNLSWAFSAGAMVSTLNDLHTYARALATGRGLLSERMQTRRLRFVPLRLTGRVFRYGLGIAKFGTYLGHNGQVPGYGAMMLSSPDRRATLIALGNTAVTFDKLGSGTPPDPDLFGIADKLREVLAGDGGESARRARDARPPG